MESAIMLNITLAQYDLVYNAFSFTIAVMGAATVFAFLNRSQVAPAYRTAMTLTGIVTLIAGYHYFRIANSWEAAFIVEAGTIRLSGVGFNDAYRYVDWLLTVPLLLIELILVMRLSSAETVSKSVRLGLLAALMVALGYPGEIASDHGTRWLFFALSMIPFSIIVYELFFGLRKSIENQPAEARGLINGACWLTIGSWSFYPVVFVLPMLGIEGGTANVAVQVGYTIADIVAKAVLGVLIYMIAVRKSAADGAYVSGALPIPARA